MAGLCLPLRVSAHLRCISRPDVARDCPPVTRVTGPRLRGFFKKGPFRGGPSTRSTKRERRKTSTRARVGEGGVVKGEGIWCGVTVSAMVAGRVTGRWVCVQSLAACWARALLDVTWHTTFAGLHRHCSCSLHRLGQPSNRCRGGATASCGRPGIVRAQGAPKGQQAGGHCCPAALLRLIWLRCARRARRGRASFSHSSN